MGEPNVVRRRPACGEASDAADVGALFLGQHDLIATSTFGLEAVTARELSELGYEARITQPGRVEFEGDDVAIARANLWLRTAERVLVKVGQFGATDFGELFNGVKALPWERWIPAEGAFPVRGKSVKSQLGAVSACQKITKKAIVDRLMEAHGTGELPEGGAVVPVEVALLDDCATLCVDTSGAGLHKRGYRDLVGAAPLKETLAAGLVLLSFWRPDRPLIDPFCGSGTICIEAAMIGMDLAPGREREFAAEHWAGLDGSIWGQAYDEADARAKSELPVQIIGLDVDESVLSMARRHARQAGVGEQIHFQCQSFGELRSKREYGCLITNPPYGQRLSEMRELDALYRSFPDVLRRLRTWSHFILTAYPDFEQVVGQEADRRRKLYNGRIECTYYQFHGPPPPRPEAGEGEAAPKRKREQAMTPAFGGLSGKGFEQAELFRSRLVKRQRHLRRWPTRQGITCYRLYDRDIPEIPLVVDRYEDHLHLSEYQRPHDRSLAEHADWLDLMAKTAAEALEVPRSQVFVKRRGRQRGDEQYDRQSEEGYRITVQEGGLRFCVNLSDYVDTGLFLDHRVTRGMVRDEARGKRFLNLFAYTGSFTVYAAAGGASETTTVDWSNTYLDWARQNMELNGFTGQAHRFAREDAMSFVHREAGRRRRAGGEGLYDLVVVDPPTFSNSKRTEEIWETQRDHVPLLAGVFELLAPGGVVYFSTNYRRFKFDEASLLAKLPAGREMEAREISRQTVPSDYRNRRIHRCWRITVTGHAAGTEG